MQYNTLLKSISDEELLRRLSNLLTKSRRFDAELVAHIGEVDERKLYAARGWPSMFAYCTDVLHLSESVAFLRITVARASRKHPVLLEMLTDGRLHLSGIIKLLPHLNEENRESLLKRASHKSKRKIDEIVAELAPKPDVLTTVRKLPERRVEKQTALATELFPDRVETVDTPGNQRSSGEVKAPRSAPVQRAVMEPLSPARYKIQFTASAEFCNKLERLRALKRSTIPDGDIAAVLEAAVTDALERLESKRFGKTKAPRKTLEDTDTSSSSRHIPAAVKRAVVERDGSQCTFVTEEGTRCPERDGLEFHHRHPFARGGSHGKENVFQVCRAHNEYMAELDYGKDVMEKYLKSA